MLVVIPAPLPATRPRIHLYPMSVVKAHQAFTILTVQRQRIANPMRALFRPCDALHRELHPVLPRRIDNKNLPVKIKKPIKTRVMITFTHNVNVITSS